MLQKNIVKKKRKEQFTSWDESSIAELPYVHCANTKFSTKIRKFKENESQFNQSRQQFVTAFTLQPWTCHINSEMPSTLTFDIGVVVADCERALRLLHPRHTLAHHVQCAFAFLIFHVIYNQQHLFWRTRHFILQQKLTVRLELSQLCSLCNIISLFTHWLRATRNIRVSPARRCNNTFEFIEFCNRVCAGESERRT